MAKLSLTVNTISIPDDIISFLSEHDAHHLVEYSMSCVCGSRFTHRQTDMAEGLKAIEAHRKSRADD